MLKAGSLVYSLFIITIVGMLCSAFILASYYHNTHLIGLSAKTKQLTYLQSGITLLKGNYRGEEYFIEEKTLFEEEEFSAVTLKRKPWGVFDIISCSNQWKDHQLRKDLLLGDRANHSMALYLSDLDRALSLSGKTVIKGETFLPKAGVKRAYIEGTAFKGSKLINGTINESSSQLPKLSEKLLEAISQTETRRGLPFVDTLLSFKDFSAIKRWSNSFAEKTVIVEDSSDFTLSDLELEGNFIFRSQGNITVKKSAALKNVLLFAKNIMFEAGTKGSVQAFAKDTLVLGENSELSYPSVLGIVGKKNTGTQRLSIKKGAILNGIVLQQREEVSTNDIAVVAVEKEAVIRGVLYCKGKVIVKGSIYGNVFCNLFSLTTSSSIYENHLLDAEMDISKRSQNFVNALLFEEDQTKTKEVVGELE